MRNPRKTLAKILIFSFAIVLFCFLSFVLTYADPPPVSSDTVYFEPFPGSDVSFDGDTLYTYPGDNVKINVKLKNINTIFGFFIPPIDTCYDGNILLDSAKNNGSPNPICFEGGRVEYWRGKIIELGQYPHFLIAGAPCNFYAPFPPCPAPLPPGDGPIITLTFTALDSGEIYLDTLAYHWGPKDNSLLVFHGDEIVAYTPVFVPRTFYVRFCPYNPGDLNCDKNKDIIDVVFLLNYLFRGGEEPYPLESADVNCDEEISISDVVYLINYLFKDGDPPCDLRYPQCKTFQTGALADTIPPDQDCIEYQYDGEGTLVLNHINAGFNCCPSNLTADISIEQRLITITEYEHFDNTGPCYCLCLFDVDYQINNLPPGEYTIKVNEVYLEEWDELLEFSVNLPPSPYSGSFCVTRSHYPWMP